MSLELKMGVNNHLLTPMKKGDIVELSVMKEDTAKLTEMIEDLAELKTEKEDPVELIDSSLFLGKFLLFFFLGGGRGCYVIESCFYYFVLFAFTTHVFS